MGKRIVWTLALALAVVGAWAAVKVFPSHLAAAPRRDGAAPEIHPVRTASSAARQPELRRGAATGGTHDALTVATVIAQPGQLVETVNSTGTLRAEESVELQPEISGKVTAITFKEGSRVRRGDLLVKLNDAEVRANLTSATYRQDLAVLREQRFAKLLKQGVARQEEYDTALNDVNIQKAQAELVHAQLAKTEIRALRRRRGPPLCE